MASQHSVEQKIDSLYLTVMDRADPILNMQLWDEAVNFGGYGIIPI